ncbi:MAG: toxin-antitoxin system YwqK family antitoxin [Putridiphycobacter sp.]
MKKQFAYLIIMLLSFSLNAQQYNQKDAKGLKHGEWRKPYKDVKVYQYIGQFNHGVPTGVFTYYYKSGNVQSKINFVNGTKAAYANLYHESSGRIMAKGKYVNEQKDSLWLYFDNVGQLKSQEWYTGGKLNGQRVIYYEPFNGQYRVSRFEYYKNGVLDGQFKEYYPNTKLKAEGVYKDGFLSGIVKYYHPNGKIQKVERYAHNVKHGWWVFYDEKGQSVGKKLYYEGRALKGKELEEKAKLFERK